ncbi:zinc finger BED domain-containing protein DAYSLEEPER-like [Bidens hawaiensis]|uniref:zinc finger BED domain-containing protein DAYSLEEPER-like n=1 Tax=Bidens hawaiensis TaxID=980011 RepID=UPI00404B3B85
MDMDVDDEVHSVEEEDINDSKSGLKRKQNERKEISPVWQYFIKHTNKKVGKGIPAECKKCHYIMIYDHGQGMGNHTKHIKSCFGSTYKDVGQMLLNSDMKLKSSSLSNNTFREMIIDAIVMHKLPLSFVGCKAFRYLFKYLQPDVNIPYRNTVKYDLVQKFKREKEKLKVILMESPGRLCLTKDLWTSITTDGYLAITVHYIDKHWVLQKRVLSFSFMPPPHASVAICENVFSILVEWELDRIEKKCSFLEVLCDKYFSGTKYPTANLYCAHVFLAYLTMYDGMNSEDEYIKNIANLMMGKFQKYWYDFSPTLAAAVVLDPRFKLHFIDWSYSKGEDTRNDSTPTSDGSKGVKDTSGVSTYGASSRLKDFDKFQSKDFTTNQNSKLRLYLEESRVGFLESQ